MNNLLKMMKAGLTVIRFREQDRSIWICNNKGSGWILIKRFETIAEAKRKYLELLKDPKIVSQ